MLSFNYFQVGGMMICILEWKKNAQKTYSDKLEDITTVRSKIFPFTMNELIETVRATEVLNQLPDDIKNKLDAESSQLNADALLSST